MSRGHAETIIRQDFDEKSSGFASNVPFGTQPVGERRGVGGQWWVSVDAADYLPEVVSKPEHPAYSGLHSLKLMKSNPSTHLFAANLSHKNASEQLSVEYRLYLQDDDSSFTSTVCENGRWYGGNMPAVYVTGHGALHVYQSSVAAEVKSGWVKVDGRLPEREWCGIKLEIDTAKQTYAVLLDLGEGYDMAAESVPYGGDVGAINSIQFAPVQGGFYIDNVDLQDDAAPAVSDELEVALAPATVSDETQAVYPPKASRPWKTVKVRRPTLEEYEATVEYWQEKYPNILEVERVGESSDGLPIYLFKITDKEMSDTDKQVAMVAGLHAGAERSGGMTNLHVIEWLLSDDPLAIETRAKQVILVMPIVNPYAFFVRESLANAHGVDPYSSGRGKLWNLETLEITDPIKAPELVAFKDVVDRFRPEFFVDNHGVAGHYAGQLVFETTGSAYSNFSLRPWDWRIAEHAIEAAAKAGFGSDRAEADAQRLLWGPPLEPLAEKLWFGRPYFYTGHYLYARYHTLLIASEIGWEQSGLVRTQALLEIGNKVWRGESKSGYPVNTMKTVGPHQLRAWGTNATQRRDSREELWKRQGGFVASMLYTETDTRASFIVATTPKAIEAVAKLPVLDFLENIAEFDNFDHEAIRAFVEAGPEKRLGHSIVSSNNPTYIGNSLDTPIQNGLAMRLRIPYPDPKLLELRLNGHLVKKSMDDGYEQWFSDGFTYVQINIPPEATRNSEGLYIVTCAFLPKIKREYGWRPPVEVMQRLKQAKSKHK